MQIDPHRLGPLAAEDASPAGPDELFSGARRYLSRRQMARTAALRDLVAPRVDALLEPGEQVLYLARAHQIPPVLDQLGFGYLVYAYHTVALVLTDRRILELMLDYNGKRLSTRTRSFAWGEVTSVRVGWRGLVVKSRAGRTHRWKLPVRGDRKVLALLAPRITERLLGVPAASVTAWPTWHCPECRAPIDAKARGCDGCGTTFRSRAMATWLSLAFPGAGLYYAGHPVLGTLDLLGELFLFALVANDVTLAPTPAETVSALWLGVVFFVLTKSESIHLARVLVHRTKPVGEAAATSWRRFGIAGAVASLAAILALPAAQGLATNPIDHDLVFAHDGWQGRFERATWRHFAEEPLARSEWVSEEDWTVTVLAEPLARGESFETFARNLDAERRAEGQPPLEPVRLGRLDALQAHTRFTTEDGVEAVSLRYFVLDREGRDAHLVFWNVAADGYEEAERLLEALIATGDFGPPRAQPALAASTR